MKFHKVLIANRGTIACRILRTLRKLQIIGVCVYSVHDSLSLHVRNADESYEIDSYLNQDTLIEIAKACSADAIHPGYGFLAENPGFAQKCRDAGIAFIGPSAKSMIALGLKHEARKIAIEAQKVPLLPGSDLLNSVDDAKLAARSIGYPVILKSTAGGGGIGMKICFNEESISETFEQVQRTAQSSFRDSRLYLEKYVKNARHVEVQIFGDGKGNVTSLSERDCSLQRRNQKIVEEAPAFGLSDSTRSKLREASLALAKQVDYFCAGTVEFILDPKTEEFFFLEVNARLQVEHGVTEEIFPGLDLVEWQVKQAMGEFDLSTCIIPKQQGHSIQVRVYSEDPNKNFEPCTGTITCVEFPFQTSRIETWVEPGCEISSLYDSMIAKIIVRSDSREESLSKLASALKQSYIGGIETNLLYLLELIQDENVRNTVNIHTSFLSSDFVYHPNTIDVISPGTQTSVQDYPGRINYWAIGVPPSGPMDNFAFRYANCLVGNSQSCAGLEITLSGPSLRFNTSRVIALCGASMNATLNDHAIQCWIPYKVTAGSILHIGSIIQQAPGCRAYLAISNGGIDVPSYLGSKSTFTLGKFGGHAGRNLQRGDVLHLSSLTTTDSAQEEKEIIDSSSSLLLSSNKSIPSYNNHWNIQVLYGPHGAPDFFQDSFMDTFLSVNWKVHFNSNRLGIRLLGPKPEFSRLDGGEAGLHPSNIHDNEYAIGTINFTGDLPVILANDGPSLGGFVCPYTIIVADLWKIGQLKPGDTVKFIRVTYREAYTQALEQDALFDHQTTTTTTTTITTLQEERLKINDFEMNEDGAVILKLYSNGNRPEVVYRLQGDRNVLVEFGPLVLDIKLRLYVLQLMKWFEQKSIPGIIELSPGVRSVQIQYDYRILNLQQVMKILLNADASLRPVEDMEEIPTRVLRLPLAFDASSTREAISKYRKSIKDEAPWLPSNIEFIRRINGLSSIDEVQSIIFQAEYLVLGLGDVYLGAPCAVPLDPRHRLLTTKYNPARTYTAEGEVGIGGVYMCIYGMDSPGGYQLIGRTVPVWNTYSKLETKWLLRFFDRVQFFPMNEADLLVFRKKFLHGQVQLDIRTENFNPKKYFEMLRNENLSIDRFQQKQQQAFILERERWEIENEKNENQPQNQANENQEEEENQINNVQVDANSELVYAHVSGRVWLSLVKENQPVRAGDKVLILEAMKLEIAIVAPIDGIISKIFRSVGDLCNNGDPLLVIRKKKPPPPSLEIQNLLNLYRNKELTPRMVMESIYDNIDSYPNVFISLADRSKVLDICDHQLKDDLPLFGIPFVVKDNIDVAGFPTTCACPSFSYIAKESCPVVTHLMNAGAIFLGKTNMDQFAAGLVGIRTPYGICRSVIHNDYMPGGSSAGSGVAVGGGLASFSLGTDTAGSGRIPALCNNIVGWKPTRGLLSTRNVVPACRSIDCVTVFALTASDISQYISPIIVKYDAEDPYSRKYEAPMKMIDVKSSFKFGVPDKLEFFGDEDSRALYFKTVDMLKHRFGGEAVEIHFEPFKLTAELLYHGPWVSERYAAIDSFLSSVESLKLLHPVTSRIILGGANISGSSTFKGMTRLKELERLTSIEMLKCGELLLVPTAGTMYKVEEIESDPVQLNTNMGYYTNFVNFLDYSACAVPFGFKKSKDGLDLPFGITLIGTKYQDFSLLNLAAQIQSSCGLKLGGTNYYLTGKASEIFEDASTVDMAVVGAHLRGQPLHKELEGTIFVREALTLPNYKLYKLSNTSPLKPGLVQVEKDQGSSIRVEIYRFSEIAFARFVRKIPDPLCMGTVNLMDGNKVKCFLCEAIATKDQEDISSYGGWKEYLEKSNN